MSVSKKGHIMKGKRYHDKMKAAQEGGMIAGPVGAAMLPQNVIMKYYPMGGGYLPENLNDGLTGIDKQMGADSRETKSDLSPTKY